ncbi:potassium-transporting ATPase subunit KdpA [Acinetobacter larvae]|uniref:Potassium-transporting ATPase subunit KdpA n=1 Tax=Acinetobacter larvae TaxID=1789224 RepID=A0A1B2LYZ2_9GAMM|nr:potassium-transporting ATPase subunit KdpA [Acinetobacter larvae]
MWMMLILLALAMFCAYPLGKYLAAIMRAEKMPIDGLFYVVEQPIYRLLGINPQQRMTVSQYIACFGSSCVALGVLVWLILMNQAILPFNPDHIGNMSWDLALHTMISFLTNTNQQHYAGQLQLSYFSQMTAIVALQVITPMMGLAMLVATLRALFPQSMPSLQQDMPQDPAHTRLSATSSMQQPSKTVQQSLTVGNFWADVIRPSFRFLLPLCLLWSLLLNSQGVPATLAAGPVYQVLDPHAEVQQQKLPLGPVAPLVAIKQLGSNGGGWYGSNSAVPLENPTPLSNAMEMFAIILIPMAVLWMVGFFTRRMKLSYFMLGCMLLLSISSGLVLLLTEAKFGIDGVQIASLMEGKEQRLGWTDSALWAAFTTQVNNGSVNMMHDSAAPLSILMTLLNMLLNCIWGGIGSGVMQFLVYLWLAVFIAGLMTGRTPEVFGRKLEATEIKYLAILIVLQPAVVLGLTAITLAFPLSLGGLSQGSSTASFHDLSRVLYEYSAAYANNGSGLEGLADNSIWWNVSCGLALLLGRFPTLIIPLWIAARLSLSG